MFAIAGIVLLLIAAQLEPGELVVGGLPLPLVPMFIALGVFGLAIDLKLRKSQLIGAPQLVWAAALAGWLWVTNPSGLAVGFTLFLLLAQGVQSFRALTTVTATLVALVVVSAALAAGRGVDDASELAVSVAVVSPLLVAYFERNRSPIGGAARTFALLLTLALVGLIVIVTQSRVGQIVFSTVTIVQLTARDGRRGFVLGALVAALVITLGHGAFPRPPAYDAVALVWASAVIYVSFKILVFIARNYADDSAATIARTWARALAASLAGVTAALVMLPLANRALLWIYVGLAAALYQATRAHDPKLQIGFDRRDLYRLAALDLGILGLRCL